MDKVWQRMEGLLPGKSGNPGCSGKDNPLFDFILDFYSTTAQICQIHAEHMTVNTPHGYYWRTEEEKNALIKVCESYPNPKPDEGIKTITLPSG